MSESFLEDSTKNVSKIEKNYTSVQDKSLFTA